MLRLLLLLLLLVLVLVLLLLGTLLLLLLLALLMAPAAGVGNLVGHTLVFVIPGGTRTRRPCRLALRRRLGRHLAHNVKQTGAALALVQIVLADEVLLGVARNLRGGARLHKVTRDAAPVTLFCFACGGGRRGREERAMVRERKTKSQARKKKNPKKPICRVNRGPNRAAVTTKGTERKGSFQWAPAKAF